MQHANIVASSRRFSACGRSLESAIVSLKTRHFSNVLQHQATMLQCMALAHPCGAHVMCEVELEPEPENVILFFRFFLVVDRRRHQQ